MPPYYIEGGSRLERPWDEHEKEVTEIVISEGITTVSAAAFQAFDNLVKVTLPASVKGIGFYSFSGCEKLTELSLSDGIVIIDRYAFNYCESLTEFKIPDGVEAVCENVFANCDIKRIEIPASLRIIEKDVLTRCGDVEFIEVDIKNEKFCSFDGVVFSKDMKTLIRYPKKDHEVPTTYIVPDSVNVIGDSAFKGAKITGVQLPEGLTKIEDYGFYYCGKLENVNIPASLTEIGEKAFGECSVLKSIVFPGKVKSIGYVAFFLCKNLETIEFAGGVEKLNYNTFSYTDKLKSIKINSENSNYCVVDGVVFTKDMKTVIKFCPKNEASSYVIPSTVETIGDFAFNSCKNLKSVEIPDSVTEIKSYAFEDSTGIESITVPKSVKKIENSALYGIYNINYGGTVEEWKSAIMSSYNKDYTINCSDGVVTE